MKIIKTIIHGAFGICCLMPLTNCQPNEFQNRTIEELNNFSKNQNINSDDLGNFWMAYDAIHSTDDVTMQRKLLKSLFLDKATVGQKKMIEVRNYSVDEYLKSINEHPQFWNSIRKNTENLKSSNREMINGIAKLLDIYPTLREADIFYTVGAHRSPGTGVDNLVLLGAEFALGDSSTITSEIPEHLQKYYEINPIKHLQFLMVHEYVHTQQKEMVHDLLSLALYEGIADFVAETATGRKSPFKAFVYGPAHNEKIKERFALDMYKHNSIYNWLWNSPNNEFGTRDLGYYVGYKIAALYFQKALSKKEAIKTLIELDFSDREAVTQLVDASHYFNHPLNELKNASDNSVPFIIGIENIENKAVDVDPHLKLLTIHFSEAMNTENRGFDFGPMGEDHVLKILGVVGFSNDKKSLTVEVRLQKQKRYQLLITDSFLSKKGVSLKPYLLDFTTRN